MRKSRKLSALFLSLLLTVGILAGCGTSGSSTPPADSGSTQQPGTDQPQSSEPIRIGAIFDATGGASSLGKPERDTVMLLQEVINAQGGINGRPIEIVFQDSETDDTKALLAMKKFAEDPTIVGIVGGSTSAESLAMMPEAEKHEIPFISVAASIKIIEPVQKWVFKTPATDRLVVERILIHLKEKGLTRVAWISSNNAYGDSGRVEFEKLAPQYGVEMVANERFNLDDTEMTAQFTNIKAANPQAVVIWAIPPGAAVAQKAAHQLQIGVPIYQSHGIANQAFIDQSGEAAEGVIFPAQKLTVWDSLPENDPLKPVAADYVQKFEAKYGYFPTTFGAHAYDGVMMMVEAIKAVGPDRAKVRDHIEGLQNFVSAGGVFSMSPQDHMGISTKDIELVLIKDGKWTLYAD